ncbi:hypothetical protein RhiirA5_437847 [Rhizophagus irregularis]|uniref:CCHC-type domain-containing protein n=1 Tax=Rhizophagus irregularis TaxID=588596 RepID=A0A2N0NJY6_9GLOM|nr:hypothetical protein RhiirA5_437847 [Rhizophagus irregularis]
MASPMLPISQRTRSEMAKNMAQDESDDVSRVSSKGKETNNITAPLTTNQNTLQNMSSPVFLVSSPEKVNTNTAGQLTSQNSSVNNDIANKQTFSPIISQIPVDHNDAASGGQVIKDQQVDLPDIEMIVEDQNDDINQYRKLENNKIIAVLEVPINDPANIDEYKKFIKVIQNSILEDSILHQEDITGLHIQIITQKISEDKVMQTANDRHKSNKVITGIALQATLISQQTFKELMEIPYRYRVVQVFNASIRLTTAIVKPFMRKYGELEEEECYSRRLHAHAPNRQVIYITFKDANSVAHFYNDHVLWIYGEMLYVTPFLMNKVAREGLKQFLEFYIPRNTYTNDTQKYAYIYFKDEAAMLAATQEVLLVRNKQAEWSEPNVQSCFRCGYTGHFLRDCDYVPPRTRPMTKNEYFRQIREILGKFVKAVMQEIEQIIMLNLPHMLKWQHKIIEDTGKEEIMMIIDKIIIGDVDNIDSFDDEKDLIMNEIGMHEWDEPSKMPYVYLRSCDIQYGIKKGGSMHMNNKEKEEFQRKQTNDNLQ